MTRNLRRAIGRPAAIAAALVVAATAARAAEIDPEADRVLRAMSDHLTGLKSFALRSEASTDVLLQTGEKVQLVSSGEGVFDRERGFRFRRDGINGDVEVMFDGAALTLYVEELNGYHTLEVEGGPDAALDEVRHAFGLEAAGGVDLLYANPYEGLLFGVESGDYLGETLVAGVRAHHLAYRAEEVDWQLWISAEGDPIPLRYVITSKWTTGAPQFTVQVREWDSTASVADADLAFTPPEGATEIPASEFDAVGISLLE